MSPLFRAFVTIALAVLGASAPSACARRPDAGTGIAALRARVAALETENSRLRAEREHASWEAIEMVEAWARLNESLGEERERVSYRYSHLPQIDAVVEDSDGRDVLISAGSDEGVVKGTNFIVYRGNTFVGKVIVIEADRHTAVARVLFTAAGQSIRRDDCAATRLD